VTSAEWIAWQLTDSAFPAGGFTHSCGLESAAQHGDAVNADDVCRLALTVVRQAGRGALPFVAAAHRAPDDLPAWDRSSDLFLNQRVSNRASRSQGRAFLYAASQIFPEARLQRLADRMRQEELCGHHAPVFGAVLRYVDVDADTTARLFLYQAARAVTAAGVRLGLIGVFDGQRLHPAIAGEIERTTESCRDVRPADVAHTAPILDLLQSTHDRLYSRLFQS